ncbi:MAG: hypothetical protein ACRDPW_00160 [Mycobacteriales bacterium]
MVWWGWGVASPPAISKARTRLGSAVLAALFDRVCVLVAAPDEAGNSDYADPLSGIPGAPQFRDRESAASFR